MDRFKQLRDMVLRYSDQVAALMPHHPLTGATNGQKVVEQMKIPGTTAHALMIAICVVIAEDLKRQEFQSGLTTPDEIRAAETAAVDAIAQHLEA